MTIRRLRASLTRLVLLGAMAAALAAGGIAVGPRHEAAAMPRECGTLWNQARSYASLARYYQSIGDTFNYLIWHANTEAAFDAYNAACW